MMHHGAGGAIQRRQHAEFPLGRLEPGACLVRGGFVIMTGRTMVFSGEADKEQRVALWFERAGTAVVRRGPS
jgi:hypothetical protein